MSTPATPSRTSFLRSLGPAIIVASVVLGPGSILASSKVGCVFGYEMVWVLVGASVLLVGMAALSARLGVTLQGTLCEELAQRAGRPVAVLAGGTLFLIATCFQFGNNLGVLFAIEPFLTGTSLAESKVFPAVVLLVFNAALIAVLYGFRRLYRPVEVLMKTLVGLMIVGFAGNLIFAKPSLTGTLGGLVPRRVFVDDWLILVALVGTTLSIGGAFYQSYLVRQKGWTREHLRQGLVDSVVGISTLCFISLMIVITAAAVLYGKVEIKELNSAADVAKQLQPAYGSKAATALFCLGIFAGALSSFLVNAMIGGTVLADGLGCGGSMDDRWPKAFTVLGLLVGMGIAVSMKSFGVEKEDLGGLILFAQALTVLGNPLLAGAMLWLATRKDVRDQRIVPRWMIVLAAIGFVVVLVLAARLGTSLFMQIFLPATTS